MASERRRHGPSPHRGRALLLTGPLAIAGVIAGAWGGSATLSRPASGAGAQTAIVIGPATSRRSGAADTAPMVVRVRLSSVLQSQLQQESINVTLPSGATVGTLLNQLSADEPVLAAMGPSIMIAVSGSMASPETVLVEGETVELMSPYAGG